jgi:hypothetical protein
MKYGELAVLLRKFEDGIKSHRTLYNGSLNTIIPDYPVRNGESVFAQEEELTRQLYILEPYLQSLAHRRWRHQNGRVWDIFSVAVGNEHAFIKVGALNEAILELKGVIAVVENEPSGKTVPPPESPKTQPPTSHRAKTGDIKIGGGSNVTIGEAL